MKVKVGYLACHEMEIEVDDKYEGIFDVSDYKLDEIVNDLYYDCEQVIFHTDPHYTGDLCWVEDDKGEIMAEW